MASSLQRIADIITQGAGWKKAIPDEEGIFRFFLDGGLDFCLRTPDNKSALLLADLGAAPQSSGLTSADDLERLASLAAASLKKCRSTFSIAGDRLELHRFFSLRENNERDIQIEVRDFLNDLAWWKKQISTDAPKTSSNTSTSPFSFTFSNW